MYKTFEDWARRVRAKPAPKDPLAEPRKTANTKKKGKDDDSGLAALIPRGERRARMTCCVARGEVRRGQEEEAEAREETERRAESGGRGGQEEKVARRRT